MDGLWMDRERLHCDSLLLPYIQAACEADSERLLTALVSECVEPVIRRVIRSKLRVRFDYQGRSSPDPDAEDIYGETLLQALARLKECKAEPAEKAIGDLRSYVAVIAYHNCYEYLRLKYPQRHNLKNKLRYLLTHQPRLALWEGEGGDLVCGFAKWREQSGSRTRSDRLRRLLDDPPATLRSTSPDGDFQRANPADLAAAIFNYANHPIELDDLVEIVAALWGVKDKVERSSASDEESDQFARVADPRADVEAEVDQRLFLKWLWEEIVQLPLRQRMALLLNLRDEQGGGVAALLPGAGVASLRQIAAALEMAGEEFARLWPRLPLDDASIAELLGCARQQVINLRKCARERLARRRKAFEREK
jgi:DNA-directed RNA polymerase specialized sigma24 family protein